MRTIDSHARREGGQGASITVGFAIQIPQLWE
jgi:hypothetical protein